MSFTLGLQAACSPPNVFVRPPRRQGRDNLVHNPFDHIKSSNNKFQVWKLQLRKGGFTHFPSLSECVATDTVKQVSAVADYRTELSKRFTVFKSNKYQ